MQSVELPMAFLCMFCKPRWFPFSFMLSCWCSIHRVRTLFFDSSIYFPLHELSNLTEILLVEYLVAVWACFIVSIFSVIFVLFLLFFSLLYFMTKFFKSCLLWPFSTNISIKNVSASLIYFSEHIEWALWRKPLNTFLMMLG